MIIFTWFGHFFYATGQNNLNPKNDSIQLNKYIDSARVYFNTDYNIAYQMALKGLSEFQNSPYKIGQINLLHILTEINYYYKNRFDSSLIYLNRMRVLMDSIKLERGKAWYELNLANIYYYQNDLNKAMQLYNNAKNNAEIIQDSIIIIDALTGISDILMQWGEYEKSLQNLYIALNYSKSNKMLRMQFLVYDDIANIYKLTGKYDSSICLLSENACYCKTTKKHIWYPCKQCQS